MINFPSSPANGQQYTNTGRSWQFNATVGGGVGAWNLIPVTSTDVDSAAASALAANDSMIAAVAGGELATDKAAEALASADAAAATLAGAVKTVDLAAPDGASRIGQSAATSPPGTVQAALNNMHGIDVTMHPHLAHPSASVATNTAAFNSANAAAIAQGKPVYIPPIGTFTIGRLTPVVGDLIWMSAHKSQCKIKVDSVAWPYAASGVAILDVTGSFRTRGITYDQNWPRTTTGPANYRDDRNPATWGGYWFVQATQTTSDEMEIRECCVQNMVRGFFSKAADKSLGGAKRVIFTENTGDNVASDSQTIIAAEASQSFYAADNPGIVTQKWNDGGSYVSNGLSAIFPWGGKNVRILDNELVGYQLVCRGPSALPWAALTAYVAGEEFKNGGATSYRVVTGYTSSATFGAADTTNCLVIYNPMEKISVIGNGIESPIADTAIYNWRIAVVDQNTITTSGDMGIAASGTAYISCSNNVIDGVRNGGIDVTGGGFVACLGNIVKDIARASDGVYSRIDVVNPNVWASNGGFNLAAITVGLPSGTGTKQVNITGNNCYFETLPPVSDPGPNNGGLVRAQVQGIYSQTSSNSAAQNTLTCGGNTVQDLEASVPNFFVAVATLRFGSQAITGTPQAGEVFANGSVKFILVAAYPAGGFVFVRKFQGATAPFGAQVFTGARSGATITAAAAPQLTFLASGESGNIDYTSKYLGDSVNDTLRGVLVVDPASIANGTFGTFAITVPGAVLGDYAIVAPPYQIAGLQLTAYVSNANEVTVILKNDTGGAIDLASGTWKARVLQG